MSNQEIPPNQNSQSEEYVEEEEAEEEEEVENNPEAENAEETEEIEEVEEEEEDNEQVQNENIGENQLEQIEEVEEQSMEPSNYHENDSIQEQTKDITQNKNIMFFINPNLIKVLSDQTGNQEKFLKKLLSEIKINSNKLNDISLYIYIHFLLRNSLELINDYNKNAFRNYSILYFIDKKISPFFNLEKILSYISENGINLNKKDISQNNDTNLLFELEKRDITLDDMDIDSNTEIINNENSAYKITLNYFLMMKSMNSRGHYDLFTKFYIVYLITQNQNLSSIIKSFLKLFIKIRFKPFNKETYLSYVDKFLESNAENELNQIMEKDLKDKIKYFTEINDKESLFYLEKLLIQLLGHFDLKIRKRAVILLNTFYDGHTLQLYEPFNPEIKYLKDDFKIEITYKETPESEDDTKNYDYFLFLCTPLRIFSVIPEKIEGEKMIFKFGKFRFCGYYDYVLIRVDSLRPQLETKGRFIVQNKDIKLLNMHSVFIDSFANPINNNVKEGKNSKNKNKENKEKENANKACYKNLKEKLDDFSENGINALYLMGVLKRDEFLGLKSSPYAIINRSEICELYGTEKEFLHLMKESHKKKIKIFLDLLSRISSSHYHKKYKDLQLYFTDKIGKIQLLYGAEGNSVNYEDNMFLNYRNIDAWNLLITDTLELCKKYNISGVNIDNAHLWPNYFGIDYDEMFREELDHEKKKHYSNYEILNGSIVLPNEESGYWTAFDIENFSEDIYPNPLFIKLTKSIWQFYPNFIFIGEFNDKNRRYINRQFVLSKSGLIPKIYLFPQIFSQIYNINLGIDPLLKSSKKNKINNILKSYHEYFQKYMPKNNNCIISSGGDIYPYPTLLFGKGNLPYITALFTMDYLPQTYMKEINGSIKREQYCSFFEKFIIKKDNSQRRPNTVEKENSVYYTKIEINNIIIHQYKIGDIENIINTKTTNKNKLSTENNNLVTQHYIKMRQLRNNHKSLLYGKIRFLKNENPKVLSFSRIDFEDNEIAIIAINFGDTAVSVDIDFSSIQKEYQNLDVNTLIKVEYWSEMTKNKENSNYYFMEEVFSRKHCLEIMPYESYMLGISLVKPFNIPLYKKTFSDSLSELCKKILEDLDRKSDNKILDSSQNNIYDSNIISSQLKYLLNNDLTLCEFAKWLNTIQSILSNYNLKYFDYVKNLNFLSENWKNSTKYYKYISLLNTLPPNCFEKYPKIYLYSEIIQKSNDYGPICFITPEIGRWTSCTELGYTIDELSKCLGLLGLDVYIISFYYQKNSEGKKKYLENDKNGFIYMNSFTVEIDNKYNFDYYFSKIDNVKLYFIKNDEIFPENPLSSKKTDFEFQLRQLALIGKSSLELLCNITVIPSIIITNDYLTGFTPAYGKGCHFGEAFKNSVFFHFIHNFEEGVLIGKNWNLGKIHQLTDNMIIDKDGNINGNQCALMNCDQWGTLCKSYMKELIANSKNNYLLKKFKKPFAYFKGIPKNEKINEIVEMIKTILLEDINSEYEEQDDFTDIDIFNEDYKKKVKEKIQQKYFDQKYNEDNILLGYIGELSEEKGLNLILDNVEKLIQNYGVQILLCGEMNNNEINSKKNKQLMENLSKKYPHNFWAKPKEYFNNNVLISYGCDFGLIPHKIDYDGITLQEFYVSGTPVISYKASGIKELKSEYNISDHKGNGILFDTFDSNNFMSAIIRAIKLFSNQKEYDKCCFNAFNSVVDIMDVARAWASEFYRLKEKIFFDNKEVAKDTLEFKKNIDVQKKIFDKEMSLYNDKQYIFNYNKDYEDEEEEDSDGNIQTKKKNKKEKNKLKNKKKSNDEINENDVLNVCFIYEVEKGKKFSSVKISGNWDNWEKKTDLVYDPLNNRWKIIMKLHRGNKYIYKYIIDGEWTVNKCEKTINEGNIVNNIIKI